MNRSDIYNLIEQERIKQDKLWGGPDHDDLHTLRDWVFFIVHELGELGKRATEHQWIKIAAIAVAAYESIDRYKRTHCKCGKLIAHSH